MNYLTFINRIARQGATSPAVRFLVSGNDQAVRDTILDDVIRKSRENGHALIVVDDTGAAGMADFGMFASYGYRIRNGMSGEYCLYNPFQLSTIRELSKIRQLLETLEYDEKQKAKLIAYLNFIRYMESMENKSRKFELTVEKLGEYCTAMAVEERLQDLADAGVIDERQRINCLSKYAEICSAAADFEDMLFLLMPFISGKRIKPGPESDQALVFPTGELGEDETIRNVVLQLLLFGMEENNTGKITVLVFDKGYGDRRCIFDFLKSLPPGIDTHVFSDDIFTLCDASSLAMLLNRFTARVYSRHLAMDSCAAIERACGGIDVVKSSYNVAYDRRWRANRPWDVLMGNNKTETYTKTAPVREPRYRKEMIMSLAPGNGIVEFMGNTTVFSI